MSAHSVKVKCKVLIPLNTVFPLFTDVTPPPGGWSAVGATAHCVPAPNALLLAPEPLHVLFPLPGVLVLHTLHMQTLTLRSTTSLLLLPWA